MKRSVLAAALLISSLRVGGAAAEPVSSGEPPLHLNSESTLRTDGGSELRLPKGYFMDEPTWEKLDREVRRLQEAEVRLKAERDSYRGQDGLGGWGTVTLVVIGVVTGAAGGYWVAQR